jgi:hypothetical protein
VRPLERDHDEHDPNDETDDSANRGPAERLVHAAQNRVLVVAAESLTHGTTNEGAKEWRAKQDDRPKKKLPHGRESESGGSRNAQHVSQPLDRPVGLLGLDLESAGVPLRGAIRAMRPTQRT